MEPPQQNFHLTLESIKSRNADFESYIHFFNQQLREDIKILHEKSLKDEKYILDLLQHLKNKDKQIEILTFEYNKTIKIITELQEKIQLLQNQHPDPKKESNFSNDKNVKPSKKRARRCIEYIKCSKCGSLSNSNGTNICNTCKYGKYTGACKRCSSICQEAFLFCIQCTKIKGICLLCNKVNHDQICSECMQTLVCKKCGKPSKKYIYRYCFSCYESMFGLCLS